MPQPNTTDGSDKNDKNSSNNNDHDADDVNSNKNRDHFYQTLSSFFPQRLHNFADQQRVSRLEACRNLESVLRECQENKKDRVPFEQLAVGIKMLNFFGWRQHQPSDENPCIREEHGLWACRAAALQCGKEMINLRNCFKTQGPEVTLSQTKTAYEGPLSNLNDDEDDGCYHLQTVVGSCIWDKAIDLQKRREKAGMKQP